MCHKMARLVALFLNEFEEVITIHNFLRLHVFCAIERIHLGQILICQPLGRRELDFVDVGFELDFLTLC